MDLKIDSKIGIIDSKLIADARRVAIAIDCTV